MNNNQILLSPIPIDELVEEIFKAFKNNPLKTEEIKLEPSELVPRLQIANELSISTVTLNDWTKKGILQSYNLSGKVYYKRSEIFKALSKNKNLKYRRDK